MAGSTQIRFTDDMIGDPNDLDDLIEATGRDVSDVSGAEDQEQRGSEAEEGEQGSGNDEENKKKDDKSDDPPKKKRILAPRLNLNPERLKGPRGLTALLKEFEKFKFRGKGHEMEDLERVLARMEHWAHRLHPKLHFEDFITKAEKLCTKKKEMQVYMNRLRMGLETADEEIIREEDEDEPRPVENEALNEFDKLLDQQISYYEDRPDPVRTPKTPSALPSYPAFAPTNASTLTTEQKEMIARKKKEAQEKRQARLRELEEEQLREATAASLATVSEENSNGIDSFASAEVSSVPVPSNNADMAAEQRDRAARNKQLALERLRARRLAAQERQLAPTDLNVSSSSDLAVPLSPSGSLGSPKATSRLSPVESQNRSALFTGSVDPCHEKPDQTNETEDGASESSRSAGRTGVVSSGRGQCLRDSSFPSEDLGETGISSNISLQQSAPLLDGMIQRDDLASSKKSQPEVNEKLSSLDKMDEDYVSPNHEESSGMNEADDNASSEKSQSHLKDVLFPSEKMDEDNMTSEKKRQ